jgi:methyl-accepting chemotaxis protein
MKLARKNYIVNPSLQLQLILGANVLALISAALIATLMFYAQMHMESYATGLNLAPGNPFLEQIARREEEFTRMCMLIGAAQFIIFNLTAIFLSHRIAGPLYRLERHLQDIGAGKEPAPVKFRKGDLYQPLADACNKVIEQLRDARARR